MCVLAAVNLVSIIEQSLTFICSPESERIDILDFIRQLQQAGWGFPCSQNLVKALNVKVKQAADGYQLGKIFDSMSGQVKNYVDHANQSEVYIGEYSRLSIYLQMEIVRRGLTPNEFQSGPVPLPDVIKHVNELFKAVWAKPELIVGHDVEGLAWQLEDLIIGLALNATEDVSTALLELLQGSLQRSMAALKERNAALYERMMSVVTSGKAEFDSPAAADAYVLAVIQETPRFKKNF